jgi:hypothetical protein
MAKTVVGTEQIRNDSLLDEDINSSAGISGTKISPNFGTQDLVVDTDTLFVDESTDRVGINTAVPSNALSVSGSADISGNLIVGDTAASGIVSKSILRQDSASGDNFVLGIRNLDQTDGNRSDLIFVGSSDTSVQRVFARIRSEMGAHANTSEDGDLAFSVVASGTLTETFRLLSNGDARILTNLSNLTGGMNLISASGKVTVNKSGSASALSVFDASGTEDISLQTDAVSYFTDALAIGSTTVGSGVKLDVTGVVRASSTFRAADAGYTFTDNTAMGMSRGTTEVNIFSATSQRQLTVAPEAVFVGEKASGSPLSAQNIQATSGSGTDISASDLEIGGGQGTGTGIGGDIILKTAPSGTTGSSLNAYINRLIARQDGGVNFQGIATSSEPAVSAANTGTIFYDSTLNEFRQSKNGGAYEAFGGGATWTKFTLGQAALATAATTNTINLLAGGELAAGGVIQGVKIKHSTLFDVAGYTIEVGITGNTNKYASAFDVTQAVSDTTLQLSQTFFTENHGSATDIKVTANASANLDTATTGSVDIWVLISDAS